MKVEKWVTFAAAAILCLAPIGSLYGTEKVVGGMGGGRALSNAGIYIAVNKGYFKAQGIEWEGRLFKSAADTVPLLGAGQLDVATGAPSAGLINAVARGIDMRIVADKGSLRKGTDFHGLVMRKDLVDGGRYKGPADLKGLKIAIAARGVVPDYTLGVWAKRGGLKLSDVNFIIIGPGDIPAGLTNKAFDGAVVWEPIKTLLVERGIGVLAERTEDTMPDLMTASLIYSAKFAKERKEAAIRFMVAYLQGNRDYTDAIFKKDDKKRAEVIDILVKESDVKDPAMIAKLGSVWLDPNGEMNKESVKDMQDFWFSQGLVKEKVDVDRLLDESFYREAVKRIGRYQ